MTTWCLVLMPVSSGVFPGLQDWYVAPTAQSRLQGTENVAPGDGLELGIEGEGGERLQAGADRAPSLRLPQRSAYLARLHVPGPEDIELKAHQYQVTTASAQSRETC